MNKRDQNRRGEKSEQSSLVLDPSLYIIHSGPTPKPTIVKYIWGTLGFK